MVGTDPKLQTYLLSFCCCSGFLDCVPRGTGLGVSRAGFTLGICFPHRPSLHLTALSP